MSKVIISFLLFSTFCLPIFSQTKCDIANFFSAKDVSYDDIFVMTKSGDIEEVELVLHPLKLDAGTYKVCLLYTSPSPRDRTRSRMPSSA